ncbi:NPC intracellular cholesterol transporter 2-like [Saccoglossus kowalevskii]|uniref:Epididymal secretory protein E1-like n=1 Tax=Saccoglossus kowalevskii TaxID=10224 RepID=A0ABM0H099_SACKO|nr:PREDICTED: epididymal secretory protein E1-like [Saccoglossus kowalevskii]
MVPKPMLFALFCVAVLPSISLQKTVTYKDCGSVMGSIQSVEVSPCSSEPCVFKKSSNVTITIHFTAKEAVTKATSSVHGIIGGVPIPFPLPQPDACKDSGLKCPLVSGQAYDFQQQLEVKSSYPSLKLVVEWEIKDQANKDIVCIEVPAQISS